MSLIVATLALAHTAVRGGAKPAIILGSRLFVIVGIGWLRLAPWVVRSAARQG